MAIAPFLAMTAAEIRANPEFSEKIGWMACHFSPYGTGLSNLPCHLPEGSLLILNDRTPWWNHDAALILDQLTERVENLGCHGLLLDFQHPGVAEVAHLAGFLTEQLNCPVGVAEAYAGNLECPVFLPPVPLHQTVAEYLLPWQGRDIWLELALDSEEILLTPEGSSATALLSREIPRNAHRDERLHCSYSIWLEEDAARFTLGRSKEDLNALLEDAENYGVTTAVGLWQELYSL